MQISPTAPRVVAGANESRRAPALFPACQRVLAALESAAATTDEEERRRLLTFVVLGAGRGGVAIAGALAEALPERLAADYRLDPASARIVLVGSGVRVLPGFHTSLSSLARDTLKRLGVELHLGVTPTEADAEGIVLAGKRIPSATVLWADSDETTLGFGRFAPVCRGFAVAEIGTLRLSGSLAWLAWLLARWWSGAQAGRRTALFGWARVETARRKLGSTVRARGAEQALAYR